MIDWTSGDPATRARLERWLGGDGTGAVTLRDNPRRRLVRLDDEILVKHFKTGSRHPLRERFKGWLGRSPAAREHAALAALFAAAVPVPEPLALGRLAGGDRILALRFHPGGGADHVLAAPPRERRPALRALGDAVAALHRAGWVHGDLHAGNVVFTPDGPLLVDLQHARRSRLRGRRIADLGDLDYSLWGRAKASDRLRLRVAALGGRAATRDALLDVGDAARVRAHRHGRSRTRRALRPGRRFAAYRQGACRGLRLRDFGEAELARALAGHRAALAAGDGAVLVDDGRSRVTRVDAGRPVIVKEVRSRGLARRLADVLRGSSARRAWRAGHGLLARGVGAALPLAYVEERRLGAPVSSAVVLADLAPARDALETEGEPAAILDALVALLVRMHGRGVDHGDLKATHVFLEPGVDGLTPHLIDFESARFRFALAEEERLDALAQLNASLPDRFPAAERRAAFERYCAVHPFDRGRRAALGEVARRSLARRHRWSGRDCALTRDLGPSPGRDDSRLRSG